MTNLIQHKTIDLNNNVSFGTRPHQYHGLKYASRTNELTQRIELAFIHFVVIQIKIQTNSLNE